MPTRKPHKPEDEAPEEATPSPEPPADNPPPELSAEPGTDSDGESVEGVSAVDAAVDSYTRNNPAPAEEE